MNMLQPDLWRSCLAKNRYETEEVARTVGRQALTERQVDLWVYPCAYCLGWHLTSRERAPYWHVGTEVMPNDDFLDILGDPHFWARLVDMPFGESEIILRETRRKITAAMNGSSGETVFRMGRLLGRLRDELHYAATLENRLRWTDAVRKVCGEDALGHVLAELERVKAESTIHEWSAATQTLP